jgi:hypothetical protein
LRDVVRVWKGKAVAEGAGKFEKKEKVEEGAS